MPILGMGLAYFLGPGRRATAVDQRSGEEVWRAIVPGAPSLLHHGQLLVERAGGLLSLLDGRSGAVIRPLDGLRYGGQAVSVGSLIVYGENAGPWCYDSVERRTVWQHGRDRQRETAGCFGVGYGTIVNGDPNGTIRGLSLETGKERWTVSVSDLSRWVPTLHCRRPGEPQGAFAIYAESTVFVVRDRHVVSLDIREGKRRWMWQSSSPIEEGLLYGDSYHVLIRGGIICVLEAESGTLEAQYAIQEGLREALTHVSIASPFLVSERHYWVGSHEGYLMAFEREGGRLTWVHRPDGARSTAIYGNGIEATDEILLYSDDSDRVYCIGVRSALA